MVEHALRRHRVAHDGRPAGAQDAGLLAADTLAVRAEEVHVIEVDAGDHRAIGVDDVDRIEPPAQPTSRIATSGFASAMQRRMARVVNSK
jgi:hypothetical protein